MTKELRLIVEGGSPGELEAALTAHDISSSELTEAIHLAARLGRVPAIRALVSAGASVEGATRQAAWKPLHTAVEHGRMDAIRELVALGANPNSKAMKGMTPLHLAVDAAADAVEQVGASVGLAVVRLLLDLGANPTVQDDSGRCAREWGEDAGCAELSELLG